MRHLPSQKSKFINVLKNISSLLILSNLLILTNFCPGEANFLSSRSVKIQFLPGGVAAPGPRHFQRIFYNTIYIPVFHNCLQVVRKVEMYGIGNLRGIKFRERKYMLHICVLFFKLIFFLFFFLFLLFRIQFSAA